VILVDTGPLVALFDRKDGHHARCVRTLKSIRGPIASTVAVLTEAFHILQPSSVGADRLRDFTAKGAMSVWFFDQGSLLRAFELMELYSDRPMDLADASLVVAAESLNTRTIFTIDRDDFQTYRVRRGHRHFALEILPAG
jgi:predicted nucleic acid-binding protein